MPNASGLSRGDRNRNKRLDRLRALVPATNAVLGIDLADRKQAAALTDHDSRVLARHRAVCRAWELGPVLDWAVEQARAAAVHHPAGAGQGRRALPARGLQRRAPRPLPTLRARATRAAHGGLAGHVGRPAREPGAARASPAPDHPRAQPSGRDAGPRRLRGDAAALAACRGGAPRPLGPDVAAGRRPQPVAVAAGARVGAPPEKVISAA